MRSPPLRPCMSRLRLLGGCALYSTPAGMSPNSALSSCSRYRLARPPPRCPSLRVMSAYTRSTRSRTAWKQAKNRRSRCACTPCNLARAASCAALAARSSPAAAARRSAAAVNCSTDFMLGWDPASLRSRAAMPRSYSATTSFTLAGLAPPGGTSRSSWEKSIVEAAAASWATTEPEAREKRAERVVPVSATLPAWAALPSSLEAGVSALSPPPAPGTRGMLTCATRARTRRSCRAARRFSMSASCAAMRFWTSCAAFRATSRLRLAAFMAPSAASKAACVSSSSSSALPRLCRAVSTSALAVSRARFASTSAACALSTPVSAAVMSRCRSARRDASKSRLLTSLLWASSSPSRSWERAAAAATTVVSYSRMLPRPCFAQKSANTSSSALCTWECRVSSRSCRAATAAVSASTFGVNSPSSERMLVSSCVRWATRASIRVMASEMARSLFWPTFTVFLTLSMVRPSLLRPRLAGPDPVRRRSASSSLSNASRLDLSAERAFSSKRRRPPPLALTPPVMCPFLATMEPSRVTTLHTTRRWKRSSVASANESATTTLPTTNSNAGRLGASSHTITSVARRKGPDR